jgi:glycogen(starch) synthase
MERYKQNKLSVLMTTDTVGGIWTYCMELCKALEVFDVQFHLVTLGAPMQQWQRDEVSRLNHVKLYTSTYKLEWMSDPWKDVDTSSNWLLLLEQEIQPDVIHLNSYCYAALPFRAPKIVVAHSDVYSWWQAVKGTEIPADWNEFYTRAKEGIGSADLIIAPSKAMMQTILDNYLTLTSKKVIYNTRALSVTEKKEKEPFIFSAGRLWDEAKNIQLLVAAASMIQWQVKIAGDTRFQNINAEVITGSVQYLGKLASTDVIAHLVSASIYVLPAKYEPFGLSALEAALCGCALVLGDIPSLREIWGDAAVYVKTNDAAALAETVNRLIADEALRKYYQSKAKQRATLYSVETFATQYYDTYRTLLSKHQIKQVKEEITL